MIYWVVLSIQPLIFNVVTKWRGILNFRSLVSLPLETVVKRERCEMESSREKTSSAWTEFSNERFHHQSIMLCIFVFLFFRWLIQKVGKRNIRCKKVKFFARVDSEILYIHVFVSIFLSSFPFAFYSLSLSRYSSLPFYLGVYTEWHLFLFSYPSPSLFSSLSRFSLENLLKNQIAKRKMWPKLF